MYEYISYSHSNYKLRKNSQIKINIIISFTNLSKKSYRHKVEKQRLLKFINFDIILIGDLNYLPDCYYSKFSIRLVLPYYMLHPWAGGDY